MKRKSLPFRFRPFPLALIIAIVLLGFFSINPTPGQAKGGNAYDLIAAVNQLRKANGLPPYETNGALMAAAQAHSDYQAATSSITHTGQGGSTPKSRAMAAGYGGGAAVGVSENIAGGGGMSVQAAVQMWQGDSLHLNTMLGGNYTDVGAGIAVSGNSVYITLDVGYIAGAAGSAPAPAPGSGSSSQPGSPAQPTAVPYLPVVTSTPAADGSVTHTVQSGQTLWVISAMYKVALADLLQLNNFTENTVIHPGDPVLIQTASLSPTPEPSATAAPSTPSATPEPTYTPQATLSAPATEIASNNSQNPQVSIAQGNHNALVKDPALMLIGGFVVAGTLLIILGNLMKKSK